MQRIELITAATAPLLARPYFENGDPGPIAAAVAQVPELLAPTLNFLGAVLGPGCLSERIKEMVILRTSADASCRYCVNAHTCVALDLGFTLDEVRALRGDAMYSDVFARPEELAVLEWVDSLAAIGPIGDEIAATIASYFADHEVVELTLLASTTLLLNRLCTALQLPNDAGTVGRLAELGFSLDARPQTLTVQGARL